MEPLSTIAGVAALKTLASESTKHLSGVLSKKIQKVYRSKKSSFNSFEELARKFKVYLEKSFEQYSTIPTIALKDRRVFLNDIYQPISIQQKDMKDSEKVLLFEYNNDFFSDHPKLLIIDSAGMGKSTFSKFLFLSSIEKKIQIPVFIELRRLRSDHSILDELYLKLEYKSSNFSKEHIMDLIEDGGFLFFLDGYDEIPIKERECVSSVLKNFISDGGNNRFIITSRPHHGLNFSDFEKYEILGLEEKEAFELISLYDKVAGYKLYNDLTGAIKQAANKYNEFLENPLYVSLLYLTYRDKRELPLSQGSFYRQVYDALYSDHDLTKEDGYKRNKVSGLSRDELDSLLQHFAFHCLENGNNDFELDKLLLILKEIIKDSFFTENIEPSDVLIDLTENVPMLIKEGVSYKWIHKSFMEYFSSKFISTDLDKIAFFEDLNNNQQEYLSDFSNLLKIYIDIDKATFDDVFIRPFLKDFIAYIDSEENLDLKIIKQNIFEREMLITKPGKLIIPNNTNLEEYIIKQYGENIKNDIQTFEIRISILSKEDACFSLVSSGNSKYDMMNLFDILRDKNYPLLNGPQEKRQLLSERAKEIFMKLSVINKEFIYLENELLFDEKKVQPEIIVEILNHLNITRLDYDKAKNYLHKLDRKKSRTIMKFISKKGKKPD
ncbi:hypothetical protein SRABI96_04907 [Peribacillus sp. Bi96]|uniref:NACHT domain-containing protein n=1 Tax=Peribacillus sp. Bi96 TaxID=2884273 RepID=UPI001E05D23C|nr:hypothetical protein [Peribacillus sp. Bi96]CAH0309035.1 hypothetical protein SRABI96_04907 [Peribacillus sp. Bi96]